MTPALQDLANAAGREDWSSIETVDVPLRQQLSKAIDQAVFDELLATAPDTLSKALTLSSSITHAGDWLSVIPSSARGLHLHDWDSGFVSNTGWGSGWWRRGPDAQCVKLLLILSETIRLVVGEMGIAFIGTTL